MTGLLAAACAGLGAWFSIGAIGVTGGADGEIARLGLLPPLWLLPVLVASGVAVAKALRLSRAASLPLFCSLLLLLPWIPGHVPGVFLIWTGKVAMLLWVGIALALLAARVTSDTPFLPFVKSLAWIRDPRRAPRAAAVLACVLYIGSAWRLAALLPGGDEPHYLIITQSLLKDGDLQIANNHAQGDYLEYFHGQLREDFLRRGTNGQIYSIHAPGLSALIAPAYALHGYHGVVVFLSIVAALGGALMWRAAYQLTDSVGAAWFSWATWALTVPFFFQAFSVFPDGIGASVVLFAALPLLDEGLGTGGAAGESAAPPAGLFLTGVALALLPWLHTRFAIIAASLGACIVLRLVGHSKGRRQLPTFLAVPTLSALAWFSFFRMIYGTFSPAAPYNGYTQSSASNILTGLPALLFDQQFGVLPYAPVYGICLVAMITLARRRPRLALELSLTVLCYVMSSSAYHMWWGGSSAPARFAVPVLPLVVLPVAWLWRAARHPATRAVGLALLATSIAVTALTIVVDGGQLAYNFRDGYSRFAEWLSPLVDLPQALPSFFRLTPAGATGCALIWVAAIVVGWFALTQVSSRRRLPTATLLSAATVVMFSIAFVWTLQGVEGPTPDTAGLTLLQSADPRIRPTGVDLRLGRFLPADVLIPRVAIATPRRRPPPAPGTLLLVPDVLPAGTYALFVPNVSASSGKAQLVIGRNARPIVTWDLRTGLRDGAVHFDLPVNVGSIVIQGDDEAVRAVHALSLRPVRLVSPSDRPTGDYARRVERYGAGLAYFFDDGAFVEAAGFWVRGGADAQVAVAPDLPGASLHLFVRNAPVANEVTIEIDGHADTLPLQPREERIVPVPDGHGAALIRIQSRSGFRPVQVDAGSTDTRYLGTWIELRP
jgi:hypothetical protein